MGDSVQPLGGLPHISARYFVPRVACSPSYLFIIFD
nr:MAG TPA: hypothetical protein [Caudoviricetes sp.]